MKTLKFILATIIGLAAIIAIGAVFLFKNLDDIAARAIENIGSHVTGTQVEVGQVRLEPTEGRGEITELTVANPEGFSNEQALNMNNIALQIEPRSLRENVIVLKDVVIEGAKLRVEHQGLAETNIKALLDNIRASVSSSDQTASQEEPAQEKRYMVENLRFTNISLDVVSEQLEDRTLQMKDIIRSNLGNREQGLTAKELALAIAQPILEEGREKLAGELKQRAGSKLQEAVKERLSEKDKAKVDQLRSLID